MQVRFKSYQTAEVFDPETHLSTKYEEITTPELWSFVERTLPPKTVPPIIPKSEYPSNYVPQTASVENAKYFVARTRNHMLPVYLNRTYRGQRRITMLKNIQGDIWKLEKDLMEFVQRELRPDIMPAVRVNELACFIEVRGDYYNAVKKWLLDNKF